ncbi:glutathione S-transferase T3 [Brachypodium distachyon]|uniref:glutathione S-transferase T3 n=1 Tax=Brachypodium distachyon TaxID=15368 RepID=UPI0005300A3F|nr:glutathione S-transferase T3 [Brachypodium distachyon]|eukprot:XP_010238926.1 glutathione S-transferase T3 [Brachypodium distachyon]
MPSLSMKVPRLFPTSSFDSRRNLFGDMPEPAVDPADPNYYTEPSQFMDDLISQEGPVFEEEVDEKGKSKRTQAYAECEDKLLCEAWLEIGQDPIWGAEQKGTAYWKRIYDYFHEHRLLPPYSFISDRGEVSLQKRWGLIQSECNKFAGAHDHVKARPVSSVGVGDMAYQALEYFKVMYKKPFGLIHCWRIFMEALKWQDVYVATKKIPCDGKKRDCNAIDLEASGHTEAASRAV